MEKKLDNGNADYIVTIAKASLGAVPVVGSLLAELAGTVIPNQRIDRLANFARQLEARLAAIEQTKLAQQLADPECSDLIEEGMRQAASSLSDERRAYIASLLEKSLTSEEISHHESKHLLKILGDLSDIEIIILRSYVVQLPGSDQEFRQRHEAILQVPRTVFGAPQSVIDKYAIDESYRNHLARLGLLDNIYDIDSDTGQVRIDTLGKLKKRNYVITTSGRLLLRSIGLIQ